MKELGQVTELVRGGAGTETRAAGLLSLCPTTPRGRADACAHVHLGVQGQHCSGELGQPHAALHAPCTGLGCGRQFLPHTPPLLLQMLTFWCFVRPRLVEVGRPWEATTEGGAGHPRCWGALSPGGGRGQGVGDQEVTARDRADGAGGQKARCTMNLRPGRLRLGPPHTAPGTSPVAGQCKPRLSFRRNKRAGPQPRDSQPAAYEDIHGGTEEKYLAEDVALEPVAEPARVAAGPAAASLLAALTRRDCPASLGAPLVGQGSGAHLPPEISFPPRAQVSGLHSTEWAHEGNQQILPLHTYMSVCTFFTMKSNSFIFKKMIKTAMTNFIVFVW